MSRMPKPWFRQQTGWWMVTLGGKQEKLAKGRDARKLALQRFHEMRSLSNTPCPLAMAVFVSALLLCPSAHGGGRAVTISNTVARTDADGEIIDAHDGCLEFFQERFYLYGTRYGRTTGFTPANRYVCYSSGDLVHWQLHGEILKDPPEGVYYRPYVKKNRKTGKYVLWYNWYPTLWNGQYGVAVSDSPAGPFVIQNADVKVKHGKPGDHGLFVDDDGTGYLVYTSIAGGHAISVERLSADYLSSTLDGSDFLAKGCEAPSMLKHNDVYYVLFDSCCCFCPQGTGARVYTAKSPLGPYALRGNINRDDAGKVIIPAQQTHVAMVPSDPWPQYIWMGDLWSSRADRIKGHDLQYWSGPLQFNADGTISRLKKQDTVIINLPNRADARDGK
jgi:hypothetical protein